MKYLIIIGFFLLMDIQAQAVDKKPQSPCSDRNIIFARKFGV